MPRPIVMMSVVSSLVFAATGRGQVLASQSDWPRGVQALLERFDSTASSATTLDPAGRAALFTDDATFLNAFGTASKDGRLSIPPGRACMAAINSGEQRSSDWIGRCARWHPISCWSIISSG